MARQSDHGTERPRLESVPPPGKRQFVFFDETRDAPVAKKEFKKLPPQVQASFLGQMDAWKNYEDLGTAYTKLSGKKMRGVAELKVKWKGMAYRVLFLVDGDTAVALTAFKKKSSEKNQMPPNAQDRALMRMKLCQGSASK